MARRDDLTGLILLGLFACAAASVVPPKPTRRRWVVWTIAVAVFLACMGGIGVIVARAEVPNVNIPKTLWCQNYKGGSCVHASAIMLWRWQGQYEWADYWKRKYAYGENASNFHERCDRERVTYCDTYDQNDVAFLEWAVRTRRGCLVAVHDGRLYGYADKTIAHAVCLVHLDANVAGILDNNNVGQGAGNVTWVRRDAFIRDWLNSGSWAWSPVSTPPAPPQLRRK